MNHKKGFTLVELIGVITILALLIVILVPMISRIASNSKTSLRKSKMNAIVTAGEEYGNEVINRYQHCVGEGSALDGCTVKIAELVGLGYLEGEDDENNIIDPLTNKALNGKVLLCYNPKEVNVYATYIEGKEQYSCAEFSVSGNNSLNLSSIAGIGYVGGKEVKVNIIKSGTFSEIFCDSNDKSIATCNRNGDILEITPTKTQFEEEHKEVSITLTGKYTEKTSTGENTEKTLSKTYTFKVYPTALSIIDNGSTCLPIGTTGIYELNKLNEGELSVTSTDNTKLEGTAKDGVLYIASKTQTGQVTLNIKESHGQNEDSLTRTIYNLIVGEEDGERAMPESLVLGNTATIPITYSGLESITITSTNPDIVHFLSAINPESSTITLSGDTEFTIIAKKQGSTKISINQAECGEVYTKDITVSNLSLSETHGTAYTGGDMLTSKIVTDNTSGLTCTSSDPDAATCEVHATTLEIYPGSKANDDVTLKLKGEAGEAIYHLTVLPTSIEIIDRSGITVDKVCTELNSGINDKQIFVRGTNMGATSILDLDIYWELADATVASEGEMRPISIQNREIETGQGRAPYRDGYNSGRAEVIVRENNGKKTAMFNYYIYTLNVDKDYASIKVDETAEFIVQSSASGEIVATSSDPDIASVEVIKSGDYSFDVNATNTRTVRVTGNATGTAVITIRGEHCGEKRVRVNISGKSLSIILEPGTYTERLGSTTLSCTTTGFFRTCEVIFPEIYTTDDYRAVGFSKEKDSKTASYHPGDKITLNIFNDGDTYYGNSSDITRPVCSIADAPSNAVIGETTYYNLTCIDTGSGIEDGTLELNDFTVTDSTVGQIESVSNPTEIVNGYSYRVGAKTLTTGMFGITLKENAIKDRFENGNLALNLTNIFASEYETSNIWYIGKNDPRDVIAVLYDNTNIPEIDDGYYTLKFYGSGEMLDFISDKYPYYPPWYEYYRSQISYASIGPNITNVGSGLLYNATNLTNLALSDSITKIGSKAFANANLSVVEIPSSVIIIADEAFFNNNNLNNLMLKSGLINIGNRAFYEHKLSTLIIPESVTSIGDYAFASAPSGNMSLNTLTFLLPSNLTTIGNGAFLYHMLTTLTIPPSVNSIGNAAFAQLDIDEHSTLKTLNFASDSNLRSIGDEAFLSTNLSSLNLPSSLETIGSKAFGGLREGIKTLYIPASITHLGENFTYGEGLEEFIVDENNNHYTSLNGVIYTKNLKTLVKCPDDYYKNNNVLDVPDTVITLEKGAFIGWLDYSQDITGFVLNLPSGITNMNIEDNFILFTIGAINISGNDTFESVDGVLFSKDKSIIYRLPTAYDRDTYEVPFTVTTIASDFAYGNSRVKTITIPSSVTQIGPYAFQTDADFGLSTINLKSNDDLFYDATSFALMIYPKDSSITSQKRTIKVTSINLKERLDTTYASSPFTITTVVAS